MRRSLGLCVTAICLIGGAALADVNDLRVYQLGNPDPAAGTFNPQGNARFRIFARELGAALTSTNLTPPSTTGHSGFAFNLELTVADIQQGGNFQMPTERAFN